MATANKYFYALGRRKSATARVRLQGGKGNIVVNDKPADEYFSRVTSRMVLRQPLALTNNETSFDILVNVIDAHFERFYVRPDQFFLAFELFADKMFEYAEFDIEQGRKRSDIDDVFEQLPLPRVCKFGIAKLHQRYRDVRDVGTLVTGRERF